MPDNENKTFNILYRMLYIDENPEDMTDTEKAQKIVATLEKVEDNLKTKKSEEDYAVAMGWYNQLKSKDCEEKEPDPRDAKIEHLEGEVDVLMSTNDRALATLDEAAEENLTHVEYAHAVGKVYGDLFHSFRDVYSMSKTRQALDLIFCPE